MKEKNNSAEDWKFCGLAPEFLSGPRPLGVSPLVKLVMELAIQQSADGLLRCTLGSDHSSMYEEG